MTARVKSERAKSERENAAIETLVRVRNEERRKEGRVEERNEERRKETLVTAILRLVTCDSHV